MDFSSSPLSLFSPSRRATCLCYSWASPMSFLSCCGNAFTRSACSVEIPMSGAPHTPTGLRSRAPLTPTTPSSPSSPSSKPPLAPTECKWTIWGEPSITLAHVHAVAFYMHPPDTPVHPGWVAKLSAIMAQNKSFHEKEFPGSLMTWSLHGPIKLHRGVPYTLEGEIASNCAYDLCRTTVEALGRTAGALPPPMAHDAPWLPGGVSSPSSSTALALPTFPTVLVHPVFLDYGCEDVTGEEGQKKLHKYYVWKAASGLAEAAGIDTGAYLTSMGVTRAGGSRASYSGARAVESFPGIWASLGLLPAAGSGGGGGGGGGRVATINGPLEHVKHTPSLAPISWGVGVVTQEAWVAPDVPGSSIVAWHEGLGHSLNLPHPSYRDDTCVMSHAQYAGIPLQTACVCEELKGGMENPLCVGAGAGAGTQATEVISLPGVGKISTLQVKNGAVKVRTVSLTRPSGGGGGGGAGGALGVKEVAQGALALFAALECGKGGGGGGGDLGKRGVSLGWVFDFEGGGETSSTSATAAAASTPLPQKVTLLRRVEGLHPTPNSLCLSSKEPMVPPFPPTLPKPQSTTTFAAGVGEVTLSIPPTPHPSSPSSATAQGTFPLSLFGPRAGSDERASAIESLRLLCNDIVTAAVAESDSAIRRKMMSSSSSSSSIQDGEVVLDEGGAWVETVLTLMPSSSGGVGEGGEVVCCTYSASDAYHFKEVWSGFVVGEGGSIPTSLGAFASHFSPSSLSSWWIPSGVEVWANAHPALFPSIYIPSLGGDSEGLSPPNSGGGGGAAAAPVTPQKAARTLIWEEDERTSSTRLHLLLNDKSRDITLALPLLSSSSSLISSSGPLGRDGYRPFVKGGYVAVW